jgi:hypothetical protein
LPAQTATPKMPRPWRNRQASVPRRSISSLPNGLAHRREWSERPVEPVLGGFMAHAHWGEREFVKTILHGDS